jgi:hypothetical protein
MIVGHAGGPIRVLNFWGIDIGLVFGPPVAWAQPWTATPGRGEVALRDVVGPALVRGAVVRFLDCRGIPVPINLKAYLEQYVWAGRGVRVTDVVFGLMARWRATGQPVHGQFIPGGTGAAVGAGRPARRHP